MPIAIASALIPKNQQNYYLLEDTYFRGGMRVSLNTTTRDALHPSCKKAGMLVWTQTEQKLWQLQADLTTYLPFSPVAFHTHNQQTPSDVWDIVHAKGSTNYIYNVYDDYSTTMLPNDIFTIDDQSIQLVFATPVSGKVVLCFDMNVY